MKRNDLIIIVIGLLIALVVYLGIQVNQKMVDTDDKKLEVYIDGALESSFDLDVDTIQRYETEYGINEIEIVDGVARIVYANCLTQSCIRDGDIDHVNETIICLPHRFHLKVVGDGEGEVDAISK